MSAKTNSKGRGRGVRASDRLKDIGWSLSEPEDFIEVGLVVRRL